MTTLPETRYARSGDVHIAYQVIGDGPLDLVYVPGWISHVEYAWEEPALARFYLRLASFSRLILFDKRGTGLSDRVADEALPTLEQRMDDVRAVMDAATSKRAALFGVSEGGPMSVLFAATYPERTDALVLYGTYARRIWAPDYPWGPTYEERMKFLEEIEHEWGGPVGLHAVAPTLARDERFSRWWASYLRQGASPSAAVALGRMNTEMDVRQVLPTIGVPTLVLHRAGDTDIEIGGSRYIAERIPGARFVELAGADHIPFVGDADALLDEIQEFLTGVRPPREPDRVLATVMFIDIVGSTERAAEMGDHRWRDLLEAYHGLVRKELATFDGRKIDFAGDGFLATFDGPARAIRCACAIRAEAARMGLAVRAGLHTGECELIGGEVGGIAVHIGARVGAKAGPGEVLVSSTVKDLVAGSGIRFSDGGVHALRGVPGEWHLFSTL